MLDGVHVEFVEGEGYDETHLYTRSLTNEIFLQIKCNDPNIKSTRINLSLNIDWEKESGWLGKNTNLEVIHIECDCEIEDAVDGKAIELSRSLSQNRSVKLISLGFYSYHVNGNFSWRGVFPILFPFFEQNRYLRSIHLCNALEDNRGVEYFVSSLSGCNKTYLQRIAIDEYPDSTDIDGEMSAKLVDLLMTHENLMYIHYSLGNTETVKWCTSLGKLLRNPNSKIRELDLSLNNIDDEAAKVLADGLCHNKTLKILNLRYNHEISSIGWSALAKYFSCPNCSLEFIDLRDNEYQVGEDVIIALGNQSTLKDIFLSTIDMSYPGLRALSTVCSDPDSVLVRLDLTRVLLDDEGAEDLGSSLANNTKLEYLDLSGNNDVSSNGWRAFFRSISHSNSGLNDLGLGNTNLQDEVIPTMVESLSRMKSLKILSLQDNGHITTVGWYAFAILLFCPDGKLERIDISLSWGNNHGINDEVASVYSSALANNSSLRTLYLGDCAITEVGFSAVNTAVCNKSSITTIYSSNHTLERLLLDSEDPDNDGGVPEPLVSNLYLNEFSDKGDVARRKIILYYFENGHTNIDEFLSMNTSVLPHAMSWMCRDDAGLTLLFKFALSKPSLFESGNKAKSLGSKRKRV